MALFQQDESGLRYSPQNYSFDRELLRSVPIDDTFIEHLAEVARNYRIPIQLCNEAVLLHVTRLPRIYNPLTFYEIDGANHWLKATVDLTSERFTLPRVTFKHAAEAAVQLIAHTQCGMNHPLLNSTLVELINQPESPLSATLYCSWVEPRTHLNPRVPLMVLGVFTCNETVFGHFAHRPLPRLT